MSESVERQILDRLTTIEVMLKGALQSRDDHETRLRSLEAWRWKTTGIGAAIGAVIGTVGGAAASAFLT